MYGRRRPRRDWAASIEMDLFAPVAGTSAASDATPALGEPPRARSFSAVPGATAELAVPVAALTETARAVVEGALAPIWVRGEISDFKRHRNGHWYFCLRDATAQVRCVVWSRNQRGIPASPDEGMEVAAFGQLTVYAARGEMHLSVTALEARGDGLWRKALEETRRRLDADGLLAPDRKRPLPRAPRIVGMVTSPDGAAVRDVIAVTRRRAPHVDLVIAGAAVQGAGAPGELCAALERLVRWGKADVIIVGRGGGAREDLWAFNDERLARAVADCPVPVVSAVGHEIDVTITDLVADHRAATPSAAAESCVPVRAELLAAIASERAELESKVHDRLEDARAELDAMRQTLARAGERDIERRGARVQQLAGTLNALSPLATLARGFAVARDAESGRALTRVRDFEADRLFTLTLQDGPVEARPVVGDRA